MKPSTITGESYSRGRFVDSIARQERWTEKDRENACKAVRLAEKWARTRPPELACLSSQDTPSDEQLLTAQMAAVAYVKANWMAGFIVSMVVWFVVSTIVKAIIYWWVREIFFNRAAYKAVMGA